LGKGRMIRDNIGRKIVKEERNVMIMKTTRRRKPLGSGKNKLVFGDDIMEATMHHMCLNCLNRMELGNNFGITFLMRFSI
jgi:hypothetical protein